MSTIIKLIIAAALGIGAYVLASNSHFDVFPCKVAKYDFRTESHASPVEETCSLLTVKRSGSYAAADRAELTAGAYPIAVLLFAVAPLVLVFGLGRAFRRKRAG